MGLKIRPINTGWIGSFQNRLTNCHEDGKVIKTPSLCFLIEGGDKLVLVDTGMCDSERASKWHHGGSVQQPGEAIQDQLPKYGYKTEDVDVIIFTHLHWDHCQNLDQFPNAKLYVHEKEWQFAMAPIPPYYNSYEHPVLGITPPFLNREFNLCKGEEEILPGITVFPTPGHSPGSMSVQVKTDNGRYVLAGDAVMCGMNMKPNPKKRTKYFPIGRYTDIFEMWESFEYIERMADVVVPGHESKVLDYELFPAPEKPEW